MRGQAQTGFTLLELVMVIVAIGVLTAIAIPRWSIGDSTVHAQAAQVARDIRHVQMLAMSQGRRLTLQSLGNGYRAVDVSSAVITDPATQQSFTISLRNGNTLSAGNLTFDSWGRPVNATGTLLGAAMGFTLSGPAQTATLTIAPVTGFVTVTP